MTRYNPPTKEKCQSPGLECDKVVCSALELLNEVGFDGLTVRRLADKLGVKAAALYWHFENKQDLINQLALKILNEGFLQKKLGALERMPWDELLRAMGTHMRKVLLKHRDGATIIARADLSQKNMFRGKDVALKVLVNQGMSAELAIFAMITVSRYTLGFVFEEQSDPLSNAEKAAISRQWLAEGQKIIGPGFTQIDGEKIIDPEYRFQQGLEIIISGIEHKLS